MLRRLSRWASALEAAAVFWLILWYIWQLRFHWPRSWLAILALLLLSHALRKETPASLGFRGSTFGRAWREYWRVATALALALLATGVVSGTLRRVSLGDAVLGAGFYCAWGLLQQYLLNGYFANRLREIFPAYASSRVAIAAAVLFSAAHAPNWFLMIVALAGGYLCAKVYLRRRNLYFLGLAHGVIGFLLYLVTPDSIGRHFWVGPKWFAP